LLATLDKQVRSDLNKGVANMCDKGKCWENPKQLKGRPEDCRPGQVRKCHSPGKDVQASSGKESCRQKNARIRGTHN